MTLSRLMARPIVVFLLSVVLILLVAAVSPLWAAEAPTADAPPFYDLVRPYVIEVVGTVVAAALAWIAALVQRWTGQKIDQKHMGALQSALTNAAMIALERGVVAGVAYVQHSVPDAVKAKGLDAAGIARVLEPKIIAARLTAAPARPAA